MSRPTRYRSAAAGLVLLLAACGQVNVPRNTGLYLLIDTSGTYNRQVTKAEQIILVALARLQPSDSFAVARIDTASFTEKNIIAKATFDDRPSTATSLTPTQLEALKMVLWKEVAAERDLLGHYVPWLATIGSVSPLLGLLGTVVGIMNAFVGISARGSGNLAAVAPGVAEALVATFGGLAAAIPAVIAYNLFVNRIRLFAGELEGFASELIGTMAREGLV